MDIHNTLPCTASARHATESPGNLRDAIANTARVRPQTRKVSAHPNAPTARRSPCFLLPPGQRCSHEAPMNPFTISAVPSPAAAPASAPTPTDGGTPDRARSQHLQRRRRASGAPAAAPLPRRRRRTAAAPRRTRPAARHPHHALHPQHHRRTRPAPAAIRHPSL